ncbi:ATP/GTP-binding protein [Kocuria flava]|uniref:ATP/GTP-binding protein n=1 Tax=Kocuria flava TaxID=446860 RepID=A0A0U2P1S4_9MICC|nr:ATP-binding protein [Kocuria flava]ALU40845.1 ATP/GTP-binding protein [Kocuria flava]GEO93465.1 hypothetical protein KFL01_27710 [Kocuria flava]
MSNLGAAWLQANDTQPYQLSRKQGWDAFVNSIPRTELEVLSRAQMDRLSEEELADYNEARIVWHANPPTVKTPQLARAYQVIDEVMASSRRDGSKLRGSVVIDAQPGLGKTTIATRYARDFHLRTYRRHGPLTEQGHQRLPVAFVPLSAGTTLKGLNEKILEFFGHPATGRATRTDLTRLVVDCVTSCETKLIVIDDLHFVDFRHRNGVEVSNHLKGLANELPATFIYIGVNLADKQFFDEGLIGEQAVYSQTSRRATRCPVAPFQINTDASMRAWLELLTTMERHLKLADARPGMLVDHSKEIFRRTQGYIASLTTLIDRVSYRAITSGAETITKEIIDDVVIDNAAELSQPSE